jgi:hypothetical protein
MKCFIYAADIYCEECGTDLCEKLPKPKNLDERTFDSDFYPKGPYDVSEADYPQHCASGSDCLSPTIINGSKVGCFLENELTSDGIDYVSTEAPSAVVNFWREHYGL